MTLRLANITTDPPRLLLDLQAFAADVGTTMNLDLATVTRTLGDTANNLCVVDTVTKAAVILNIDKAQQEIKVEWLHRGLSAAALKPLLKNVFVRGLAKFPTAGGWRVWATFLWGKDANGVPDGGQAFCEAHHAQWVRNDGTFITTVSGPPWIIESTLGALAA